MMQENDVIGNAIWDFYINNKPEDIIVESDTMDDDVLPVRHLFRTYENYPDLEVIAMQHCCGKVLDLGAGAGAHSKYLVEKGLEVTTVETSPKAHEYLKTVMPNAQHFITPIMDFNEGKYDTILLLMNGIGLAGKIEQVPSFLNHISKLLTPNGAIICESTDVLDLFENDEGEIWLDLTSKYYGEFTFNMKYKNNKSGWFDWVYLDRYNFQQTADEAGLNFEIIFDNKESFLTKLTNKNSII